MHSRWQRGFTLVELLVVVAIIGILVSLLLPAVNAAREAGRRSVCANNVSQLAKACLAHESKWQFLPTGGWWFRWAGDPDRGFTVRQPGGWHYNILPHLDKENLWALGMDGNRLEGRDRAMIPVEEFICPSRRRVRAYPYLKTATDAYINIETPSVVGRSDYAANAGDATGRDPQLRTVNTADLSTTWRGPLTLADADSRPDDYWGNSPGGYMNATGVIFRRSWVSMGHLLRSPSCIYLLGERYVHHERYTDGTDPCDDQGWDVGYECDTNRFTAYPPKRDSDRTVAAAVGGTLFGSAHTTGFHMAFCDGSVRRISFNIDPDIHRRLGNRKDTADIDVSTLP